MSHFKLLASSKTNMKLKKGMHIMETYMLSLSPHKQNSFGKNLCAHASDGCIQSCIFTSGNGGRFASVNIGRRKKTDWFLSDTVGFLTQLYRELYMVNALAQLDKTGIGIRLNGFSDIDFPELFLNKLGVNILADFSHLIFYDYTKDFKRACKYLNSEYYLTLSRSETNEDKCNMYLSLGGNVAVVFDKIPPTYMGYKTFIGDDNDLRFLDPQNVIVALSAKGKGRKDTSGFVVKTLNK
jgi:hypothetical protein